MYAGSVLVSAVDQDGKYQVAKLEVGDVWYFPKGQGHTVQGLEDDNEFLLVFDDGDFDATGWVLSRHYHELRKTVRKRRALTTASASTTFNVDDWIKHTPKHILAKNFGLPESVFADVPSPNPYIQQGNISDSEVTGGAGELSGDASFVYYAKDHALQDIPGGGGTLRIIDTTTFPASETIAATVVTLVPGGLRELHWHPNVSIQEEQEIGVVVLCADPICRLRSGSTSTKERLARLFFSAAVSPGHSTLQRVTRVCFHQTAVSPLLSLTSNAHR